MLSSNIEKRRSYIVCFGFDNNDVGPLLIACEDIGIAVVSCNTLDEINETLPLVQHCLGIFVNNKEQSIENAELVDLAHRSNFNIRFFKNSPQIPEHLVVKNNLSPVSYLQNFLDQLVPEKFRELCLFAVNRVNLNLIPDYQTQWNVTVTPPSIEKMDFLVFCEAVFDNFVSAITVKSSLDYAVSKSETLKTMTEQDIIEYFSEVCNQVLGMINVNLKKININSKIGLPIVVRGHSIAEFKRRSSYYLPTLNIVDNDGGLMITFQFLVPFVKNAPFSRNLDFEVGVVSEDKKVLIL